MAFALMHGDNLSLLTIHREYDEDEYGDEIVTPFAAVLLEPDAHLIAAAPEMLEALRFAAIDLVGTPDGERCLKAIAKAEGNA